MAPRRGTSWQLLVTTLFLAIKVVPSSSSITSIDHSSEAIWQAIDEEGASSLRTFPLSLLEQKPEEEASSPLRKMGHRSLRAKERIRKERSAADYHFPASTEERHRLLITCDAYQSQEDCQSKLLGTYNASYDERKSVDSDHRHHIEVIHNLESIHVLSVDVDTKTLGKLVFDRKFAFEMDFARGPLVIEGSMSYYQPPKGDGNRNLQDAQTIPWGLDTIRAQEVWREYGVKGQGVKICVLDSGLEASHEDFRQSKFDGYYGDEFVASYWYEDNKGHGTHIAGTIAASDNSIGIVGIAPEAEIYIVRVFDDDRNFYGFADGTAYSTDLIAAATICKEWGADIINASLGGENYSRIEEEFFRNLYHESGILTVAASGNGGNTQNVYPAAYEGVLSVGAVDESLNLAKFSTWDPSTTDVLAPGVNILSTFKKNVYATFSGTSMAAPHATGALALILSYINENQMNINRQDIFHVLKNTMASIDTNSTVGREEDSNDESDDSHAMGVIDVFASIEYLENYDAKETGDRSPAIAPRCDNEVHFNVVTDSKGGEIYYRLKRLSDDMDGDEVIWLTLPDKLESYSEYSEEACFQGPEACYQFDIRDKGNDGISEGGGIEIIYNGHRLFKGGNYGVGGALKFGDCQN